MNTTDRLQFYNKYYNKLITQQLEQPILYNPASVDGLACSSLKIITGFTDCERISTHAIKLCDGIKEGRYAKPISINMILGMTKGAGLTQKKHTDIVRTIKRINSTKGMPHFTCNYIAQGPLVHSKVYLWEDDKPEIAFSGSANYSMQAFYKRREVMSECDPFSAKDYFDYLLPDTIDCMDPDIMERIKFSKRATGLEVLDDPDNEDYEFYNRQAPIDTIDISLLGARGDIGYGSSVNWGIRRNGTPRNPNQAYIPYNKQDKKEGFFPDRVHPDDENCPIFRVITKNAGSFHMRMAQQGNKALHTAESNAILGEWIRQELGVPSGSFITKEMLELKNKTHVTFRKYADGTYLLDI